MITVRAAVSRDIPALQALAVKVYYETFASSNTAANMEDYLERAFSHEQFAREFAETGSIFYLAEEGAAFAGYARLRRSHEVEHWLGTNCIELQRLYVDIPFQSKKVGAQLMDACLQHAQQKKYDWIWLGVWEHNIKAQNFYTRWGFEKFSEHIFQMGNDAQTDWLMRKRLN